MSRRFGGGAAAFAAADDFPATAFALAGAATIGRVLADADFADATFDDAFDGSVDAAFAVIVAFILASSRFFFALSAFC